MKDKAKERFLAAIPKIRAEDIDQINALFQPFIFRIRREREVWTSCCRRHERIPEDAAPDIIDLLNAEHTPEPIESMYWTSPRNEREASRRVTCPWCGARAKMKELGRTGNRKNLYSFHRPVILRQYRGGLWAICFDAEKDYTGRKLDSTGLTKNPYWKVIAAYRFKPGKVEYISQPWYGDICNGYLSTISAVGISNKWLASSPYGYSKDYGTSYSVIGFDEISKSRFKYCGIEPLYPGCDLFRLLTLCCIYPRQVEFLTKIGLTDAIRDYTEHGKKNAAAIRWDATDPKDFLGISMQEAKSIVSAGGSPYAMQLYRKGQGTVEECIAFDEAFDRKSAITIAAKMKKFGVKISRVSKYLGKQVEAYGKPFTLYSVGEQYKDYLIAAEGIGLDLYNSVFLMPQDLRRKHDEVTLAYSTMLAEKRSEEEARKYEPRKQELEKRYAFSFEGMSIVIPSCAAAIVQEGKNLHHCVGGYADRHISGKTTILFLRRSDEPKRSLVTVEMRGNTVIQAHGWDDERTACKDNPAKTAPEKLYADFFGVWLQWLKGGSKRNKDGSPKLPKIKREAKTA